jgi:PAS domain S-box-containing protein
MSTPTTSKRAAAARAVPASDLDPARTVVDALPPVAYWDLELRNRMANAAFCEFFGVSPADLSGRHISEVLWPDLLEVALPHFERALAGEPRRFDRVTVDLSGAARCAQVTLVPDLVDGEVRGVVAHATDITERVRAERESRDANAQLRAIFDHAPYGMSLRDLDGRYLHVNQIVAEALGMTPQEFVGRDPAEHLDPRTGASVRAEDEEMRRTGEPIAQDLRLTLADGGEHDFYVLRYPVFDERGEVSAFGAFSLDVTDRKHAEREALDAERRFRMLLEAAPDAMVISDAEGSVVLLNARAEELFGYARDELLGEPVETLIPPTARARHAAHRQEYAADPRPRQLEVTGKRRDGSEFPAEMTLSALSTDSGSLIVSAIRDITERRLAEATVARLAAVVNSSQEAIIAKTPEGMITDWNPAAERMYGYRAGEAIGMPISALLASEEQQAELTEILQRVRDGEAIENLETTRRAKDGHLVEVELTTSPIRDPHGRIIGASTLGHDITERKHAEELLRRSQERLEQAELIAQMGTLEWDLRTNRIAWSAGLYSIFKLNPEDVEATADVEDGLRQRVHSDDHELVRQALHRVLTELTSVTIEYRALRSDGRVRILEWQAEPIVDHAGTPIRLIAVVHDITDTKRARQALNTASSNLAKYAQELQRLAEATADPAPAPAALSARQLEILRLLAQGLTNGQIAKQMFITEATVKWHVRQILTKSNSTNRTEAVARLLGTHNQS